MAQGAHFCALFELLWLVLCELIIDYDCLYLCTYIIMIAFFLNRSDVNKILSPKLSSEIVLSIGGHRGGGTVGPKKY